MEWFRPRRSMDGHFPTTNPAFLPPLGGVYPEVREVT
jgi:hypothetical protein